MSMPSVAPPPDSASRSITLPEWSVHHWLNTQTPLRVADLRGRVAVLHAFQMLCPGCVSHGLPQATRVRRAFAQDEVAVVGLHTVFEHHAAMNAEALAAFNHEYRWPFPIGIDAPSPEHPVPQTMSAWGLRGTPSLIVLDRGGRVRLQHFGLIDDLVLGGVIGRLLGESGRDADPGTARSTGKDAGSGCDSDTCMP